MITIPIRVCGDKWTNFADVKKILANTPVDIKITLDFLAEGPSLGAMGLFNMLIDRDPGLITVINNPNVIEQSPYVNNTPSPSHFFHLAKNYWTSVIPGNLHSKKFGLFIGRRTISRCYIMWRCQTKLSDHFLMSLMHTIMKDPWVVDKKSIDLENLQSFISNDEFENFLSWWNKKIIYSLDGHTVDHQYKPQYNTNLDLLTHYNKFHIELVPETYSIGDTFFPTEKTIRPLVAGKPIIVYGPKNYLARMRDLGFYTWTNYWSEMYDNFEGKERWQAIEEILISLSVMPEKDFLEMIQSMQAKARHNRDVVKKLGRIHDN